MEVRREPLPDHPAAGEQAPTRGAVTVKTGDAWGLAVRIVLVAVSVSIALWLAVSLLKIVMQLVIAVILAAGLGPLVDRVHRRGLPRGAAVLLIYLGLIVALVVLGVAVIPPVVDQADQLVRDAPRYSDLALGQLRRVQEQFPFLPPIDEQLAVQVRGLGSQLGALGSQALVVARFAVGIFSGLLNTLLVLLLTLYLVVDGGRIREYFLSFFSAARRAQLRVLTDHMGQRMGGWLVGQITLCASIGLLSFVGLSVLGVPGVVLLSVLAAIGEAIPIVGPIVSAVPAVIVAFTQSPILALWTALLYLVIQQLENNILVPKVMERAVNLHPLAVILSLLVGGQLLGLLGAIVAVPVAAAISVVLDEVRRVHAEGVARTAREETRELDPPSAADAEVSLARPSL